MRSEFVFAFHSFFFYLNRITGNGPNMAHRHATQTSDSSKSTTNGTQKAADGSSERSASWLSPHMVFPPLCSIYILSEAHFVRALLADFFRSYMLHTSRRFYISLSPYCKKKHFFHPHYLVFTCDRSGTFRLLAVRLSFDRTYLLRVRFTYLGFCAPPFSRIAPNSPPPLTCNPVKIF